jgi:hypothetical protein
VTTAAARRPRRARRLLLGLVVAPIALCLLVVGTAAVSNLMLPKQSTVVDWLSDLDKARLAETTHLLETLGGEVWPGWGVQPVPLIVYNEAYIFLVGYPGEAAPPPGWVKVPQNEVRGGAWEVVPGDDYFGQPYYRQPRPAAGHTPEAFTVRVGEQWAASFMTQEYSLIEFAAGLRGELPPGVRSVVPYRLLWGALLGESEAYMAALVHEAFHAYQGDTAEDRLAASEFAMAGEARYPYDAAPEAWQAELDVLADAALADSDDEAAALAREFLAQRAARRAAAGLQADAIDLERLREWSEGLAKYAELALGRHAGQTPAYAPHPAILADPDFHDYANRDDFWRQQLGETRRMLANGGETRFYYTGLCQAALLDRLAPGWQAEAFDEAVWLEDLLAQAVGE